MILAVIILLWWWFASKSAREEVAFTWPFRELGEACFPLEVKRRLSDTFHRNGGSYVLSHAIGYASMVTVVCVFRSLPDLTCAIIYALTFIICLLTYWLVFDINYAKGIGQLWYYLGDTSDTDNWLRRFGKDVGKKKAYFCVVVIALCLAGYFLLTKSFL